MKKLVRSIGWIVFALIAGAVLGLTAPKLATLVTPLSKFIDKYCDATMAEALIRWFRTYDRISIVDGLLSLDTDKKIDTKNIEKHFTKEIDKIIEEQIGL